jgi:integrase
MNFGATEIMAPPSIFSHQELNEIGQAIRDKHTLRDQCFFALSLAQYRPIELQMMRASDVIDTDSLVRIRTQVSRASGRQKEVVLPPDVGQLLVGYIDSKGLSGDDFLFPSRNDNKSPMNPGALLNSFRSWLRDANIDPARRSLSCIRHSVLSANAKPESSSVDVGALRHNSKFMTDYYISVKRNKSDFE